MKEEISMNEKLNKLRENRLIELSVWAGLSLTPGESGVIITKDKKKYLFHNYRSIAPSLEGKIEKEYLSNGIELSDDVYEELIKIIENEILNKKHEYAMIFDLSFSIEGNYNGVDFKLENNQELYGKIFKLLGGKYE